MSNDNGGDRFHERLQERFLSSFKRMFWLGFLLILIIEVATAVTVIWNGAPIFRTQFGIIAATRMLQISLGILIGFFVVFLGVLVAWMGIEARFRVKAEQAKASLMLSSASPGILLIVCGTIILLGCLWKDVRVSQQEFSGIGQQNKNPS